MFRSLVQRVAGCAVSAAAFTGLILVGTSVPTTVSSGAVSVPSAPAGPAHVPKYVWPTAHGNPQLTGVSGDPTISDTNAGQLGVRWMSNLTAQSLTSPVVAYNQALGQTLVYAGSEGGWFSAYSEGTGKTVWSVNLGSAVRVTPTVDGPYIWVASTYAPELYKLDAATGTELCATPIYAVAEASPIVVTPPGGSPTVYMGSNDLAESGPLYSINEENCSVNWSFTGYAQRSGLWDFISYGVDATGEPLVLFGTADPDAGVYALDAKTGAEVWRFQTFNPDDGPADIGAGVTVSAPGVNGFADGMAYVPSKDGNIYALDLTTGTQVWVYNYAGQFPPVGNGSRATAALVGNQLVFGTSTGTFDLDATTGTPIWHHVLPNGDENLGAPAIEGPAGHQVVLTTNIDGQFQVLSLATGALLYSYQTHNYLASSPAVTNGNVLLTSADGFLYDFALGGGNGTPPSTAVTSPSAGSTVANPAKPLVIAGTASDSAGVSQVTVTVQEDGAAGQWWSGANQAWERGPFGNQAVLGSKGAMSTTWALRVPMPARGTIVEVHASAVGADHVADTSSDESQLTAARVDFTVSPSATAPTLQLGATRAPPGGQVTVAGGGFGAGEQVDVALSTAPPTTLATVTASATGALPSTPVTIPVKQGFGPITVTATGETSGASSSAALIVSNNWDQWRATPTKSGFELNDSSLNNNVAAGGRFYFDQAYNFPVASAIHSSVAIDQGRAFFGDDGGDLVAINVSTGAPLWQDEYPGGIDSSAAVDSNMVIFGTKSGSLVAVNEANGNPVWSTALGGAVESSPAVYGGVVYVGDDSGHVYGIDEQTGAVRWNQTLGGPVHSSPAVDTNHQTVVIGDDSGHVTALSIAGMGSVVWSAATGSAVTATPTYFSNNIFVGSTNGSEYAFNGKTGAQLWTFATNGPIVASNVTFGTDIGVGSEDGTIYYLSSTDGSEQNSLAGTVPIVGLAGSVNFAVATLQNGAALATRITGIDQTWKYNTDGFGFASSPVLNNGNVYITGLDDNLHVFSAPGRPVY